MNPKLEKLRVEQERVQRELEQAQHRQQRLENRLSYMNTGERKARTHRLITRGAAAATANGTPSSWTCGATGWGFRARTLYISWT